MADDKQVDGDGKNKAGGSGYELTATRTVPAVVGPKVFPTLTRSNYNEWVLLLQVGLQARGLWRAIEGEEDLKDEIGYRNDRSALELILRSVPPEMLATLAVKKTAQEAWNTIKTIHLGSERVREAKKQTLRSDLERLRHKPGESIDELAMRLTGIVNNLSILGDEIKEVQVMQKFLRIIPKRYSQLAMSIDSMVDLNTMSMEELTGRFKAAEERFELDAEEESGSKLLLTEEEWRARMAWREQGGSSSKPRVKWQGDHGNNTVRDDGDRDQQNGRRDIKNDRCRYCNKKGHWARECRMKKRDETAHLTQFEDEEPALLMAQVTSLADTSLEPERRDDTVHLVEERIEVNLGEEGDQKEPVWYLDTGASNHMTGDVTVFSELNRNVNGTVKFGDGSVVEIRGRGTVLFTAHGGRHRVLTYVYFIPRLRSSIVSVGQLDEVGCSTQIEDGMMLVRDRRRQLIAKVARTLNRLYTIKLQVTRPVCLAASTGEDTWLWHARYGHLNFESLRRLVQGDMVRGMPKIEHVDQLCDGCLIGKQRRTPFPQEANYRARNRLDLVHGDLCGPISPPTHGKKSYFLLLVDDKTRYMWVMLLSSKDEAPAAIKRFQASVEVETGRKLRALRTDRGGEFTSVEFGEYCANHGVHRQLTAPYSPQQNGVVERRNQSVVSMARCLLKAKGMPKEFWGEAVNTAVYLLNRSPTRSVNGMTPYEAWHKEKPAVSFLRTFGCVAHIKVTRPNLRKLEDRSIRTVFIGYELGSKAYRVYDPVARRVHITRDAVFDEAASWDWGDDSSAQESFEIEYTTSGIAPAAKVHRRSGEMQQEPTHGEPTQQEPTHGEPRHGGDATQEGDATHGTTTPNAQEQRTPTHVTPAHRTPVFVSPPTNTTPDADLMGGEAPRRYRTLDSIYADTDEVEGDADALFLVEGEEPTSFTDAERHPCWRKAMLEELASIHENQTWSLTNLPAGKRPIGLKWVFKLKRNSSGEVVKHKARLVAKGYVQRAGIDFDEVFAPVARLDSVRVILAVAANTGWQVHHLDVKSAFLNGDLNEEVYVSQPPGFARNGEEHKVMRLHKALYGLRQAPRAWNAKLDDTLLSLGFQQHASEHAVYTRGAGDGRLLLGVYVDDLIVTGAHAGEIGRFKEEMKSKFEMSDLGLLSYYLGIEVKQAAGEITLCQAAYATKLLDKAGMTGCNPVHVPMEARLKLSKRSSNPTVDATLYRSIVGSLRYLVHTRPDIAFAVGYVSRFLEAPTTEHMSAVKHLLRYIAGTLTYGCRYIKSTGEPKLVGYSDADMGGDVDDRKSTTGVFFFLGQSPVSWQSLKQKVVALSSCEAEYIAATTAACHGIWLGRLLGNLFGKEAGIVDLRVDNKSAIQLCKNPVFHDRSKHIETRYHFIRECVKDGRVAVEYIHTDDQMADMLTKSLGRIKFQDLRSKIGIVNVHTN